jgi:DNA repair exonuclease SbcCD ATPase subunit
MAERTIEIVALARDEASGVLGKISGSLEKLEETGHGLHSMARGAEHAFLAIEVGKLGVEAISAAFKTFTGSAEEATEGQRALFDGIKEFPVIGKPVSEAAEAISAGLAHAFGRESLAEREADIAKQKAALVDFGKGLEDLDKKMSELKFRVDIKGLLPAEAELAKAKANYLKTIQDLKADELKILEAGVGNKDANDPEVGRALDEDKKLKQAAIADYEAATAAANLKIEEDTAEFFHKMGDLTKAGYEQMRDIRTADSQLALEQDNREYEARQQLLEANSEKERAKASDEIQQKKDELQKEWLELQPKANSGDKAAQGRMDEINTMFDALTKQRTEQDELLIQSEKTNSNAERENELKKDLLAILGREAATGDQNARQQLDKLNATKEENAEENALINILNDQNATLDQRNRAQQAFIELKKAQGEIEKEKNDKAAADTLNVEISLLQKAGAMGDAQADLQAKKLQTEKEYLDLRKQILALPAEKVPDRQKLLDALKAEETQALGQITGGKPDWQSSLATTEDSQFLSGVGQRGIQDQDDSKKAETENMQKVTDIMTQYFLPLIQNYLQPYLQNQMTQQTPVVFTGS